LARRAARDKAHAILDFSEIEVTNITLDNPPVRDEVESVRRVRAKRPASVSIPLENNIRMKSRPCKAHSETTGPSKEFN
jgi:hypothetical protein